MNTVRNVGLFLALPAAAVALVLFIMGDGGGAESTEDAPITSSMPIAAAARSQTNKVSSATSLITHARAVTSDDHVAMTVSTSCVDQVDDIALLDKVISGLLDELTTSVKSGDYKLAKTLLSRLRSLQYGALASVGGSRTAGRAAKIRILEALAAFEGGVPAELLVEAADLLSDSEMAVALRAKQLLFSSLQDFSLGDAARAEIVVAASEELTDAATVARLYQEFIRMRHSVGVAAIEQIVDSGTDQAKSQIVRVMGSFTSNPEIQTVAQLKEWLVENGDNPDYDDWYYGGKKEMEK